MIDGQNTPIPQPLTAVGDGDRDPATGKFQRGNHAAVGNPFNRKMQQFRSALMETISVEDVREIVAKLVTLAKGGDLAAIKVLLDRLLGTAAPTDIIERIENLETFLLKEQNP